MSFLEPDSEDLPSFTAEKEGEIYTLTLTLKEADFDMDLIERIYKILGGDDWFTGGDDQQNPRLEINPEELINSLRTDAYPSDNREISREIDVNSMVRLMATLSSVGYHRGGYHRLPAEVPTNLAIDNNSQIRIYDAMSWQEWLVEQIDAVTGAYPLNLKLKNAEGSTQTFSFQNSAEAIAEVLSLLLSLSAEADIQTQLSFKTIAEAIAAKLAATNAYDYAKANAEFLGYRGRDKEGEIPLQVTPGAKNLKDALKPSEQKIARWKFDDKTTLSRLVAQAVIASEICKSAVMRGFDQGEGIYGDGLVDRLKNESDLSEDEWRDFIDELVNPTGFRADPKYPRPDINNLVQEEVEEQ